MAKKRDALTGKLLADLTELHRLLEELAGHSEEEVRAVLEELYSDEELAQANLTLEQLVDRLLRFQSGQFPGF